METVPHPAQEGTSLSDRDTGVPLEVHNAPQCTAVNDILARVGDKWSVRVVMGLADGSRRTPAADDRRVIRNSRSPFSHPVGQRAGLGAALAGLCSTSS